MKLSVINGIIWRLDKSMGKYMKTHLRIGTQQMMRGYEAGNNMEQGWLEV